MASISATILTYNEEKRIGSCLESLRDIADEIIVIDSYSSDATAEICRSFGCKVTLRRLSGYGAQRQYATSLTSHSYVLSIDADEELSPALRASLMELKKNGFDHRVYAFSRLNFYCGEPIRHCGLYPDTQIRLFDKRYANWNLHDVLEKVIFRDTVRPQLVDGDILHYLCDTPDEFLATEKRHAAIRAKVLATRCDSINPVKPYIEGAKAFFDCFLSKGGIFDGRIGNAISRQRYHSTLLAYKAARRMLSGDDNPSTKPNK